MKDKVLDLIRKIRLMDRKEQLTLLAGGIETVVLIILCIIGIVKHDVFYLILALIIFEFI